MLDEGRKRTSITVAADFEEAIEALRAVGAKRIAVGAKWEPTLMANVSSYLADAGIEVIGTTNDPHTASQVVSLTPQQGADVALALGRRTFLDWPKAEAVLLAGGAWQNLPSVMALEKEFGRPVVTNPTASFWASMKQFGLKPRRRGFGMLLDGLFDG
jgi:maleate cis-trans isomerase